MSVNSSALKAMRPLSAIIGGLMLAAAFPPVDWGWLAPIAVALLTLPAITSKRLRGGFGWGFVGGAGFFLALLSWMSILGVDAWILLALYCSLWFGLLGLVSRVLIRLAAWPVWLAAAWVAQEALRDRIPYGGFPWGRLAYSQGSGPPVGFASVGGPALITFVIALSGALLCWALLRVVPDDVAREIDPSQAATSSNPHNRGFALVAVATAILICLAGALVPRPVDGESDGGPSSVTVALIQGGVPGFGLDAMAERRAVLNNHVRQTKQLATSVREGKVKAPELVIWPENSSDIDPLNDFAAKQAITEAADAVGVPILVGAVVNSPTVPGTLWNVGIVWNPGTGPSDQYVKRHPVPFGEYLPGRSILQRFITRFDRIPYDFSGGSSPGVLQVGPARLADVICFEIAYDEVVRDAVVSGGRAISVQTNNATYTHSGFGGAAQSEQQAAMSQVRAVEHGRAVLVAATSGVTAIIDPAGRIVERAPILASTSLVGDVPLRDTITIADHLGAWPEWLVFLAVVCGVFMVVLERLRSRRVSQHAVSDSRDDSNVGDR